VENNNNNISSSSGNTPPILTITGSDPVGGSGVQADLKTISALGGYAVTAVTSITVQNTLGILDFHDLPASVVEGQVEAVVNDVEPRTVKIGMIRTLETLDVVVRLLKKYHPGHVVYRPVTHSAGGERLVPREVAEALRERLEPLCTVVIQDRHFSTHGEANTYASAVACYLNEGMSAAEALERASTLMARSGASTGVTGLRSRSRELYERFLKEVEMHFREDSDVRSYADRLNVAGGYLAQVTRRFHGNSPKAIIDERILEEAKHMLEDTDGTIQETAYALGFTDQAHFAKFFRRQVGMAPTHYRRLRGG